MKWFTRVDLLLILALAVLVPFAIAESPVLGSSGDRVEGVTASPGTAAGELIVSWDEPTSAPLDYRVSWAPEGESFKATNQTEWNAYPTTNTLTITGLEAGASYKVKVRARYGVDGRSDWSQIAYGTAASASPDDADSANQDQSLVFVTDQEPETAQQTEVSVPTTMAECKQQMIDGLALNCSANRFYVKTMRHDGTYHFDWSVWASNTATSTVTPSNGSGSCTDSPLLGRTTALPLIPATNMPRPSRTAAWLRAQGSSTAYPCSGGTAIPSIPNM